mgnify:CR=1 FL=1
MTQSCDLKFGRYTVVQLLGEGAMGRVYLAQDPVLQRNVAIKVISIDPNLNSGTKQEYLARFTFEARASAQLKHPSIVTVHDAGEEQGIPWIAFEFVEGEGLDALVRRESLLDVARTIAIIRDIASALSHAHSLGIVHRDIKPANILVDRVTQTAKLTDFGIAKAPWTSMTQSGTVVGSPGYMSPEQIDGKEIDARSDIFSLGVVLYEALTGKHPFLRDTVAATLFATMSQSFEPVRVLRPQVSQALSDAVARCLAVDRDKRLATAQELLRILDGTPTAPSSSVNQIQIPFPTEKLRSLTQELPTVAAAARRGTGILLKKAVVLLGPLKKRSTTYLGAVVFPKILGRLEGVWSTAAGRMWKSPVRRRQTAIAAGVAASLLVVIVVVGMLSGQDPIRKELSRAGFKGSASKAYVQCLTLLDKEDQDEAEEIADALVKFKSFAAHGRVILGRIEAQEEDYDDAQEEFSRALRSSKGRSLLKKQVNAILKDLESPLEEEEASRSLITLVSKTLKASTHPQIKKWLSSDSYWLRWNAAKILETGGIKVDTVKLLLKDLQTSQSMTIRYRAVEKLGRLGDRRAIPALKEAESKGYRDPLVSAAAKEALDKHFR